MPEWPAGWERTASRRDSRFARHSLSVAANALMGEVRRMGGTNLRLDHDLQTYVKAGVEVFYANQSQPDDPGVVVYFTLPGDRKVCWPCDRWRRVEDNLWAIVKSLEAKRGLERWGAVSMDREYEGYRLLGDGLAEVHEDPAAVLGVSHDSPPAVVKAAWKAAMKEAHPDRGGSEAAVHRLTASPGRAACKSGGASMRDIGAAVFVDGAKTWAVYPSREALPAWVMEPGEGRGPRFLFYTAADASWSEIEVTPSGAGLVLDEERGGVLLLAPRIINPDVAFTEDVMVYDRQRGDWLEALHLVDEHGLLPDWTRPKKEVV